MFESTCNTEVLAQEALDRGPSWVNSLSSLVQPLQGLGVGEITDCILECSSSKILEFRGCRRTRPAVNVFS